MSSIEELEKIYEYSLTIVSILSATLFQYITVFETSQKLLSLFMNTLFLFLIASLLFWIIQKLLRHHLFAIFPWVFLAGAFFINLDIYYLTILSTIPFINNLLQYDLNIYLMSIPIFILTLYIFGYEIIFKRKSLIFNVTEYNDR